MLNVNPCVCFDFSSIVYVLSISLQLAGASLLSWSSFKDFGEQIYRSYSNRERESLPISEDNGKTFDVSPQTVREIVTNIFLNRVAFIDLAVGYLIAVWANNSSNVWITFFLIIFLTVLIAKAEKYFASKIANKKSQSTVRLPIQALNGGVFLILHERRDEPTPPKDTKEG